MPFELRPDTRVTVEIKGCKPVESAAAILRRDLAAVTTEASSDRCEVIVEDFSLPDFMDESWSIGVANQTMRIKSRCPLGAVYALLYVSEHFLGVKPFWFWGGCMPYPRPYAQVPEGVYESRPFRVRCRGWFVNDEVLIEGWGRDDKWKMVFEALLRCGGNMIIPGTDLAGRRNRQAAQDMGLWITHHHAEPLGAEMFSRAYPDAAPSYLSNPGLFHDLWRQAAGEQSPYPTVWCLGFRGQGDRPFWEDDPSIVTPEQRGRIISEVIKTQYDIVCCYVENPVCCTNLYGEIMELHRDGHLELPDGVIRIWADNGYGRMVSRRQGNHNPRVYALPHGGDKGPHGIYYHVSFYDLQASNHITMPPNSAEDMGAELERVMAAGAGDYAIINCGNIRPHIYHLDMVRQWWSGGAMDIKKHREDFCGSYFAGAANEARRLIEEYASCIIPYGKEWDEHAGEQLYHYTTRILASVWMTGGGVNSFTRLNWLFSGKNLSSQMEAWREMCAGAITGWRNFVETCKEVCAESGSELIRDMLLLQGEIHLRSLEGSLLFCDAYLAWKGDELAGAFVLAGRAKKAFLTIEECFKQAEHGIWKGFYDNDCLTDIRRTGECMGRLMSWLRVMGDGPDYYGWERSFIMDKANQAVMLITNITRTLSDEELFAEMDKALS